MKKAKHILLMTEAIIVLGLLAFSCCPRVIKETITETVTEYRDSLVYRDTTIKVPIPLEKDQAIVHIGDTSKLETSVAESVAYVDSTGFLVHKLNNKKGSLSTIVKIPEHHIFTGVTTTKVETISKIEYKDKPLTGWKKFRYDAFWWLLISVIGLLCWTFRKYIIALIKLII